MGNPVWKGDLAYGGRSVPVKILTAARADSISFNLLHKIDLSRVKQVLHCAAEDKPISRDELVKGFEYEKDRCIALDDAEIKGLSPDPPAVIELKTFVPMVQVDPLLFESSYYVAPGSIGDEPAYAALFRALCGTRGELAGLAAGVCLYSRERPLLFRSGATGIVAHALFYAHELRAVDQFRTDVSNVANHIGADKAINALKSEFNIYDYPDLQRERTDRLIEAKVAAAKCPAKAAPKKRRAA